MTNNNAHTSTEIDTVNRFLRRDDLLEEKGSSATNLTFVTVVCLKNSHSLQLVVYIVRHCISVVFCLS